jgi:hypothetical protein
VQLKLIIVVDMLAPTPPTLAKRLIIVSYFRINKAALAPAQLSPFA